jgi:nucleoside-diphosphate-sugar epimerase
MAKHSVKVKIDGMKNGEMTVAGGTVAKNVSPGTRLDNRGGDVDIEAKDVRGKVVIAGGDAVEFAKEISAPLDELAKLVQTNLAQQDQIEYLQEVIVDLKAQASKPSSERNKSKVTMLLNNLGSFINIATLAVTQADKAKVLFETVKNLFGV